MTTPVVYLPLASGVPGKEFFSVTAVYEALDAAGIKWVQESPVDYELRMVRAQLAALTEECQKLMDRNAALEQSASYWMIEAERLQMVENGRPE